MSGIIREEQIGPCRLILGDCLEVLPLIGRGSVDCAVTSPPYNQLGSRMPAKASGMHAETNWVSNTREVGYADDMEESDYQHWHNEVMGKCAAVIRDGGSLFVNHKCRWRETLCIHPVQWIAVHGARLRQEIIWRRAGSTTLNARMFAPNEERILWFICGNKKWTWNQPSASLLSVWDIAQDREANGHPCPFPEELPLRCIEAVTHEDDTVLEPFLGSGTTGVACIKTGRNFIGIEKEPKYFDIAVGRIRRAWQDKCSEFKFDEPAPLRQLEMVEA